ncbi:MAG: hypothetical protein EOO65_01905 [Methanosarcinales archaeon]|nr:MAG: hypothetical protein EOO65_01905 [Methanosarcinales archaeon]
MCGRSRSTFVSPLRAVAASVGLKRIMAAMPRAAAMVVPRCSIRGQRHWCAADHLLSNVCFSCVFSVFLVQDVNPACPSLLLPVFFSPSNLACSSSLRMLPCPVHTFKPSRFTRPE